MNRRSTLLLEHHLKELKLPSGPPRGVPPQHLLRLADLELSDCHQCMVQRRVRAARFPAVKTLDPFDFPAIPR